MPSRRVEPAPPRLSESDLRPVDPEDLDDEEEWIGCDVRDGQFDLRSSSPIQISSTRLTSCSLLAAPLDRVRLIDVVFDRCELSALDLGEASLNRVEFRDCRLSGLNLGGAKIENVVGAGCKVDGSSFRMVRGRAVRFDDCDLSGSDFSGAHLEGARLQACDLSRCNFSGAHLGGTHLHRSTLVDLDGVLGLKGTVIDPTQAVPVALMMLGAVDVRIDADDAGV